MASLYRRANSPFWWLKFRDAHGLGRRESTGFRHDQVLPTRAARELEANRTAEERRLGSSGSDRWSNWADEFVTNHHPHGSYTHQRWGSRWLNLKTYLKAQAIDSPRQVERQHAAKYIQWRSQPHPGMQKAGHNTALAEIRFLSLLLREAVARGHASHNPLQRLGIQTHPRREKPEVTEEQLQLVSDLIEQDRHLPHYWMLRRSFDIARWQGCRLNETWLNPQRDVELVRDAHGAIVGGTIRFAAKGKRIHVAPLHARLWPLFDGLQRAGTTETYPQSRNRLGHPRSSLLWFQFGVRHRIKAKVPGFSFHCLRVTVATRMARANIPQAKAMRYLGHASATIHRIYQRLRLEDLGDAMRALE